jgi:NDP-sugar pyrophosphorylase family protein
MLPVAILAGGLAQRLHPITKAIPKAMIEILGKPFIFHQLSYLRKQGIKKVVICIGHLGDMIKSKVGDGSKFDLKISYSFDGTELLGTGGAIKKALPILGDKFFILYGDTFLPIRFETVQKAFLYSNSSSLMCVLKNDGKFDKSNVVFKNNQLVKYSKKRPSINMNYIDYGLSVINANIFEIYAKETFLDLSNIFEKLSKEKQLDGFEVYERFYEIGSFYGLKETEKYLLNFTNYI